ncbi:MAG TPA: FMN-binding protein [Ruminiclostridium sp.]|nr:FMN-binding protein [Ruminiclostridium sp.]
MNKVKITIVAGICIIAAVGAFFAIRYAVKLQDYKKRINSIAISNVDLKKVPNGTYKGSYDAVMVAADVSVTVTNHKIDTIRITKHVNERGKKAEAIVDDVISKQSLKVDTVSGATNSSKVILKAIENALKSGEIK